jgi:GNAT superfamily N-acetyltransferase
MTFRRLVSNSSCFFDVLPQDWQDDIVPFWDAYKDSSEIYVIEDEQLIIGGGIVFSKCPPDIKYYRKEAQRWFDNGYLYLGFIWIAEDMRNRNLGSYWLNELKTLNSKQNYWLLIEDDYLHRFYQKNSFVLKKTITYNHHFEWLYSYTAI